MRVRAAGILIQQGKILLIHRIKVVNGVKDEYYVIPGGGIESKETFIQATIREFKEEVGIEVNILKNEPIYIFENDNGKQIFTLVEYNSGIIGSGNGPEFTNDKYLNKGTYSVEFVELKDIILRKINLVPEFIKEKIILDILELIDFKNISSKEFIK